MEGSYGNEFMTTSTQGVFTGGGDGTTTSVASQTLVAPTVAADDVAFAFTSEATGTNTVNTPPTGYTLIDGPDTSSTTLRVYSYARTITSSGESGGNVVTTWNNSGRALSSGIVLRGVDLTGLIVGTGVFNTSGPISSWTLPSFSTTNDDSEVIAFVIGRVGSGSAPNITFPAGWTVEKTAKLNTSGANFVHAIATRTTPTTAGAVGGGTIAPSTGTLTHMYAVIMEIPAAASGTPREWWLWNGSTWLDADMLLLP